MQGRDRSLEQQIATEVFGRKSKFFMQSMHISLGNALSRMSRCNAKTNEIKMEQGRKTCGFVGMQGMPGRKGHEGRTQNEERESKDKMKTFSDMLGVRS